MALNWMPMDAIALNELICRAKGGQAAAMETLFECFQSRLYGYFLAATRSIHDAEDLLGEMAVRLVKQLAGYDHLGRFEHWLFRIAANLVRDRRRHLGRWQDLVRPMGEDEDGRAFDQRHADPKSDPVDQRLLTEENAQQLALAMGQLDATTRQMLELRYFDAMSFRQIAEQFACPVGTALAKVHRGLKTLRQLLDVPQEQSVIS
jgi:RNA polymerase sigma factor (sigma-70 family)